PRGVRATPHPESAPLAGAVPASRFVPPSPSGTSAPSGGSTTGGGGPPASFGGGGGGTGQLAGFAPLLCGEGVSTVKSLRLSFESRQPALLRMAAFTFVSGNTG